MGRKRNNKKDKLPLYVYRGRSSYEYRPYHGRNVKRPCVNLCPLDSPTSEVWQKWEEQHRKPSFTLGWLLNEYKASLQFRQRGKERKSQDTIREQKRQIEFIFKYPLTNGKTFGSVGLDKITKGVMRKFLDKREEDGAGVGGNREKALISKAWNWASERDKILWPNPCVGVVRNPESSRDRYVTDEEYKIAYELAKSSYYLPIMMELAYLCRMRRGEILRATKDQIVAEGFDIKRLKGSKDAITFWSDRLKLAIDQARKLPSCISSIYLIHNKYGQSISKSGFDTAWQRLKKRMSKEGIEPFNFHDLKAKGVSDFEGNKQAASGHKTLAQVARYDRKKIKVKPTK